jgi:predicted flap endonuclease-1-like 5' DNA nuclease
MGYYFAMTWAWWLLAVAVAVVITWLLFRVLDRGQRGQRAVTTGTVTDPADTAGDATGSGSAGDLATARARIAELEGMARQLPGLQARIAELEAIAAQSALAMDADPETDMRTASAIIGYPVGLNDLTVVEGVGPKIRELLHGSNIRTWRELSTTPVAMLNQILDDAGPHFRIHNPSTWPRQAGLLADGHWVRYKEWTDKLKGGREAHLTAK